MLKSRTAARPEAINARGTCKARLSVDSANRRVQSCLVVTRATSSLSAATRPTSAFTLLRQSLLLFKEARNYRLRGGKFPTGRPELAREAKFLKLEAAERVEL